MRLEYRAEEKRNAERVVEMAAYHSIAVTAVEVAPLQMPPGEESAPPEIAESEVKADDPKAE